MIKYTPRQLKGNVNVSPVRPLKDFFELALKIIGLILAIYILLGFAVDFIVPRLSRNMELKIGRLFSARYEDDKHKGTEQKIQEITGRLLKNASLPQLDYRVSVAESKDINAMALPGGGIVVLSGLLKEIESENELAMVMAHELGHFAHRDHLRGLGRNLVFLVLSSVAFGADSSISRLIANSMNKAEMRFSQSQETAADLYALELLDKTYHNVAGAEDFYRKMAKRDKLARVFYVFASHPYTQDRINAMNEEIRKKGYTVGEKVPLSFPDIK